MTFKSSQVIRSSFALPLPITYFVPFPHHILLLYIGVAHIFSFLFFHNVIHMDIQITFTKQLHYFGRKSENCLTTVLFCTKEVSIVY